MQGNTPNDTANFHLSPAGNDANPCTYAAPCKTIARAVTLMQGGDTLLVHGGTYDEGEIWIRGNFNTSPSAYLVIVAYQNEIPLFNNGVRHVIIDADYVEIRGLHFTNAKFIAHVGNHTGARIIGNHFTGGGWPWAVISVEGSSILIADNNIAIDGNVQGSQGHAIYVHAGRDIEISRNRLSGMSGYGVHVFDQRRTEDPPGFIRRIVNVQVLDNTISNSRERAGIIIAAQAPDAFADSVLIARNVLFDHAGDGMRVIDQVSHVRIFNNTIFRINTDGSVATGKDGIYIGINVNGVEMKNNLIHLASDATAGHVAVSGATNVTLSSGLYWPSPLRLSNVSDASPLLLDPMFVNTSSFDFRLQANSPAIDQGLNVGLPFNGSAPDIGAVER
ncbi:MAG: right-handed parallel beta-helix repeat-containing protein [Burkholderiales bacterium]